MREEPLLATAPAPIMSLPEFYAVAFYQTQLAAERYGALARRTDKDFHVLRPIFEILASREGLRTITISAACAEACGQPPDLKRLPATAIDLVPAQDVAEIAESNLSTPYTVWSLAVRHRQRAFVFWTYVAALAGHPMISVAAEKLAREALSDGNQLRRERRLAWRSEHRTSSEDNRHDKDTSSALLESLLYRDILRWSRALPSAERQQLLRVGRQALPPHGPAPFEDIETPAPAELERIKRRAVQRAEQLSNIYLNDADNAIDQSRLDFAQKLAAHSIARLASLRAAAKAGSTNIQSNAAGTNAVW